MNAGEASGHESTAPVCPRVIPASPIDALPSLGPDGRLSIQVPLDVVLLGFPAIAAEALQASLQATQVDARYADNPALPMVPTVHYRVRALSDCSSDLFRNSLQPAPERAEFFDGNLAESSVAFVLRDAGLNLSSDRPAFVFIHLGDERLGDHGYLYRGEDDWGPNVLPGYVENARVFGGQQPFVALDVSAREDPDETYGSQGRDYEKPIALTDAALLPAMRHAVHDATMLLAYPDMNWPATTASCNAVTVLYGIRATSLDSTAPGMQDPEGQVRAERLAAEFTRVSGKPSYVDLKVLFLPVDDPELDALARLESAESTFFTAGGSTVPDSWQYSNMVHGVVDDWVDANWDRYWVAHEGCEGYLGIIIWGDAADYPYHGGVAPHPSVSSHRWMFGKIGILTQSDASGGPGSYQILDTLLAHEIGHTLGLHHPHRDASTVPPGDHFAFGKLMSAVSSVWTKKTAKFSTFEEATLVRNEVGFALQEIQAAGEEEAPGVKAAMEALNAWDWRRARDHLQPLLD